MACGVSQLSALPSERPPSRRRTGIEVVLCAGKARAGEAQQHAAVLHPLAIRSSVSAGKHPDIGQYQHGKALIERRLQGLGIGRLAHVAIGFKGAGDIVERREQGLGVLGCRPGLQADGLAPPAIIHQMHRRGVALAFDLDSGDLVAQLDGQFDDALHLALAGREDQIGFAQRAAIAGPGDRPWRRALRHRPHAVR